MKNFVQPGNNITVPAAPYALTAGQGALLGALFGVALTDAASGAEAVLATTGVYTLTALGTDTAAVGTRIYWDNTNRRCTTTLTGNTLIGVNTVAKGNGDTTVTVRLNGAF
jgi:predicted RecA/RadA family phage recombinase